MDPRSGLPMRMLQALFGAVLLWGTLPSVVRAEAPEAEKNAASIPEVAPSVAEIRHLGQTYVLAQHREDKTIETDEYLAAGETLSEWSQLLTVQRLFRDSDIDGLVTFVRKHLEQNQKADLTLVQQSSQACVFKVRIPSFGDVPEHQIVGLILSDPDLSARLSIVQYAVRPTRIEADKVELLLRSWTERFLKQADARNRADPRKGGERGSAKAQNQAYGN